MSSRAPKTKIRTSSGSDHLPTDIDDKDRVRNAPNSVEKLAENFGLRERNDTIDGYSMGSAGSLAACLAAWGWVSGYFVVIRDILRP